MTDNYDLLAEWQETVADGATVLGYAEWREARLRPKDWIVEARMLLIRRIVVTAPTAEDARAQVINNPHSIGFHTLQAPDDVTVNDGAIHYEVIRA